MANQHHRSSSSTTRLDRRTQLITGSPWHHEGPRNCSYHQRIKKKQTAEADQLSQAEPDTEI